MITESEQFHHQSTKERKHKKHEQDQAPTVFVFSCFRDLVALRGLRGHVITTADAGDGARLTVAVHAVCPENFWDSEGFASKFGRNCAW